MMYICKVFRRMYSISSLIKSQIKLIRAQNNKNSLILFSKLFIV